MVSMHSQAVDVVCHEFILFTKKYERFCATALGRFLHHTPAEAMKSHIVAQEGIKRARQISCVREGIKPKSPSKLPLLFELDTLLNIPDGFKYSLHCKTSSPHGTNTTGSNAYCASHIGCGSGCASGSSNFADSFSDIGSSDSGCTGGCGGGD